LARRHKIGYLDPERVPQAGMATGWLPVDEDIAVIADRAELEPEPLSEHIQRDREAQAVPGRAGAIFADAGLLPAAGHRDRAPGRLVVEAEFPGAGKRNVSHCDDRIKFSISATT